MRTLLVLLTISCGGSSSHTDAPIVIQMTPLPPRPAPPAALAAPAAPVVAAADTAGVYAGEVRSVRFSRNTVLRKQPQSDADQVGIIARHVRAGVRGEAPAGAGCAARWIEIAPRGWACETVLEPSALAPTEASEVALDDELPEPAAPGVYGIVRGANVVAYASRADALAGDNGRVLTGSNSVRARAVVRIGGQRFWRTTRGDLIPASSIARMSPSRFRGVALEDGAPLPAWVRVHGKPRGPATTRATPSPRGRRVRELAARTIVTVLERTADGRFARIADDEWIALADLRVASTTPPPPGTAADERWFDVDLEQQVLVAYEGERPVYATLVSTGKYGHATPTFITRIASKLQRTTMTSNKTDVYSVADVPWTMFYDHNYALHTSYWHDGFGGPRSHGCINLSPHDARLLYLWSSPDVPPGWIAVYGDEDHPGSLVRVRSRRVPEPRFRGYARKLSEVVATR